MTKLKFWIETRDSTLEWNKESVNLKTSCLKLSRKKSKRKNNNKKWVKKINKTYGTPPSKTIYYGNQKGEREREIERDRKLQKVPKVCLKK